MEKLVQLLQSGETMKALKGFEEIYLKNKNLKALYFITLIKLNEPSLYNFDELMANFALLLKGNKNIRNAIYDPYLTLCLDNNEYALSFAIAKKAVKDDQHSIIISIAYAKGLFHIDHKYDNALNITKDILTIDSLNEGMRILVIDFLVDIYLSMKNFEEANKTLQNLYLTTEDENFLNEIALKISLAEENPSIEEKINSYNNSCKDESRVYYYVFDYYYTNEEYRKAIPFLKKLLTKEEENKVNLLHRLCICYYMINEYDLAITTALEITPLPSILYGLLAECYLYKGYKEDLRKGLPYLKEAIKLEESEYNYDLLQRYYYELRDIEELKKFIKKLSFKYRSCKIKAIIHLNTLLNKWNANERIISNEYLYHSKKHPNFVFEQEKCAKNLTIVNKTLHIYCEKQVSNPFALRLKLVGQLYGNYGYKFSMDEAKKTVDSILDNHDFSNLDNCLLSVIGNYYLVINQKEEAYKYFFKGYENFIHHKDSCSCTIGFYAYYVYQYDQDTNKAFAICQEALKQSENDVSENILNLYAQLSLDLHKNLREVYELLTATINIERRYPISQLFMIIKLARALNIKATFYEKQFKKALKQVSLKEKDYYNSNPSEFLMNNY